MMHFNQDLKIKIIYSVLEESIQTLSALNICKTCVNEKRQGYVYIKGEYWSTT